MLLKRAVSTLSTWVLQSIHQPSNKSLMNGPLPVAYLAKRRRKYPVECASLMTLCYWRSRVENGFTEYKKDLGMWVLIIRRRSIALFKKSNLSYLYPQWRNSGTHGRPGCVEQQNLLPDHPVCDLEYCKWNYRMKSDHLVLRSSFILPSCDLSSVVLLARTTKTQDTHHRCEHKICILLPASRLLSQFSMNTDRKISWLQEAAGLNQWLQLLLTVQGG